MADVSPQASAIPQIDWVPSSRPAWHDGWMTGYIRGLELILERMGVQADYATLMGDCGQAFITHGEEGSSNLVDGTVDVGWWPLEPLGFMRLDFLSRTVGRQLIDVIVPPLARGQEPPVVYDRYLKPVIEASISHGVPCVVRQGTAWYVVTGCDDDPAPLIGMCPNHEEGDERIYRIAEEPMPPFAVIAVGDEIPRMDRAEADKQALEFAVALIREQAMGPEASWPSGNLRHHARYKATWRTGSRSLVAWVAVVASDNVGQWFWHANVKGFLIRNRRMAVRYLGAMRERHGEAVRSALGDAIGVYESVIAQAEAIDLSEEVLETEARRLAMVERIQAIMPLELQAADAIERANELMA